jgi:putative YhbY family RNA-binding protein
MLTLSSSERRKLRAKAHALGPVVLVGAAGPTAAVIAEVERALAAHELVKIRAQSDARSEREAWLGKVCESLAAAPVQHIGRMLVVYRPRPQNHDLAAGTAGKRRRDPRKTKKQMLT